MDYALAARRNPSAKTPRTANRTFYTVSLTRVRNCWLAAEARSWIRVPPLGASPILAVGPKFSFFCLRKPETDAICFPWGGRNPAPLAASRRKERANRLETRCGDDPRAGGSRLGEKGREACVLDMVIGPAAGGKFFYFFRPQPIEKSQFGKIKESS